MLNMQKIKIVKIHNADNSFTIRTITGENSDVFDIDYSQYSTIEDLRIAITTALQTLGYKHDFDDGDRDDQFVLYVDHYSVLQVYDCNSAG